MAAAQQARPEFDVAIVGGGVSGLTAAYELNKMAPELRLVLLEAKSRIGGRTWSVPLRVNDSGETDRFDLGGQWVGKTQRHVMAKLKELNIDTYKQFVKGKKFIQESLKGKIVSYTSDDPPGGILTGVDALLMFGQMQDDSKDVSPENPFRKSSKASKWSKMTVEQWVDDEGFTKGGKEAVKTIVDPFDAKPNEVSMLYILMAMNSAGSDLDVLGGDTGNGAQGLKIANGAMTLSETLHARISPDRLSTLLDSAVTNVNDTEKMVELTTADGRKVTAKKVIIAIPPTQVAIVDFQPPLSAEKLMLLKGFKPKSNSYKFVMTYRDAFWRANGHAGIFTSVATQDSDGVSLPELTTYDATSAKGNAALLGFVENFGTAADNGSTSDRGKLVAKQLVRALGDQAANYVEYRDQRWINEPYIEGCVATIGPDILTPQMPELLRASIGGVHFAGTETATEWIGYISGAIQAGERTAAEVLIALGSVITTSYAVNFAKFERSILEINALNSSTDFANTTCSGYENASLKTTTAKNGAASNSELLPELIEGISTLVVSSLTSVIVSSLTD